MAKSSPSPPPRAPTVVLPQIPVQLVATPWTSARQAPLSSTVSWSLLKFVSVESVMPSNQLVLCCPLLLLPSIVPSIRVFSNESVLHIRWYWSFSVSPSHAEINSGLGLTGLISLQSRRFSRVLQHHNLKASFLHGPTLTSVHEYWKNHSFDYMDICQHSDVLAS